MVNRKLGTDFLKQLCLLLNSPDQDRDGLPLIVLESYYYLAEAHKPFEEIACI